MRSKFAFLEDFYKVIDQLITNIKTNVELTDNLYYCEYKFKNNNEINLIDNESDPIIFCLGGMAYKIYEKIINKYYQNVVLEIDTNDYDFSFALKSNSQDTIELFITKITDYYNNIIEDYSYKFKKNGKTIKVNKNRLKLEFHKRYDRLHMRINLGKLHIVEFSFWYNGKISDNFTINDFTKETLFKYRDNNLNYYLLPLKLLVKTTLYAITDYFEKRNFTKCYKYIQRVEFIKNSFEQYKLSNINNDLLTYLFKTYNSEIRKKYNMIIDYPFIISKLGNQLNKIDKHIILRCVYSDIRKSLKDIIKTKYNEYIEPCKKVDKEQINEYTEEN